MVEQQQVNERQNNIAMVSNKDLFRLGKVNNYPYTRFFYYYYYYYSCHLFVCVCVCGVCFLFMVAAFSCFCTCFYSSAWFHRYKRSKHNWLNQHLSSSNRFIYIIKKKNIAHDPFSFNMYVSYILCSFVSLNLARFCLFLILMTLITYKCLSICPMLLPKRTTCARIVTYMRIMKSSFVVLVSFISFFFFITLHFFLLKKTQVLKKSIRDGDINWMNKFIKFCKENRLALVIRLFLFARDW